MSRFALVFLCLCFCFSSARAEKLWTAAEYLAPTAVSEPLVPLATSESEPSFLGSQPLTSIQGQTVSTGLEQQPIYAPNYAPQQNAAYGHAGITSYNTSSSTWYRPRYKAPVARVTVDGYLYSRDGVGDDYPLLFDDAFPNGNVILKTNDLGFSGETGGQVNIDLPLLHFGFFTSGTSEERVTKTASPADIWFFNAHAADDKDTYTVQYDSVFRLFDIGYRKDVDEVTSVYAGIAFGRLRERMDILSTVNPPEGFFSSVENDLLGGHIGARREFFNNGNYRIEAAGVAGLYFNEIEVRAQAAGIDQPWEDDDVAYSLLGNLTVVIPAWPVNFRLGYQAQLLGGVAVSPEVSRSLQIISGGGQVETSEVVYHGFVFGIEKQW